MSFQFPFVLLFLAVLPLLWWLARAIPPAPRAQTFPSLLVLRALRPRKQDAARTPWWLLLLRLCALGLIIVACAGPVWRAPAKTGASGKQIIVLDNGWAAAPSWKERLQAARSLGERSFQSGGRPVFLLTAPLSDGRLAEPLFPENARALASLFGPLLPQPWPVARGDVATLLATDAWKNRLANATVTVLSDGLAQGGEPALKQALQSAAHVVDMRWEKCALLRLSARPPGNDATLRVLAERLPGCTKKTPLLLQGLTLNGGAQPRFDTVSRWTVPAGEETTLSLPPALATTLDAVALGGVDGPAGIALFGGGAHQKSVGLLHLNGDSAPLLGSAFYLTRALDGNLRAGSADSLLSQPLSVLIAPDGTLASPEIRRKVLSWVRQGGMLVRFAGPALAEEDHNGPQDAAFQVDSQALLPVPLLHGQRQLGGPMSWGTPQKLAPFPARSPFAGLKTLPDVTVSRQVLAQPSDTLQERSWALLADGTPLVTARREGRGLVVLFHVTPTAEWSSLPLSGLFPAMLDRLIADAPALSGDMAQAGSAASETLPPWRLVSMTSPLSTLDPGARPLKNHAPLPPVSAAHPAGLYGAPPRLKPLNLPQDSGPLRGEPLLGAPRTPQGLSPSLLLGVPLALAALALLLLDALLSVLRSGSRSTGPRAQQSFFRRLPCWKASFWKATSTVLFLTALSFPPVKAHAEAQAPVKTPAASASAAPNAAPPAALETRLAYVETGAPDIDTTSREGLEGLTRFLNQRSTAHFGPPAGIVPGRDDLGFYPLIYWPVTANVKVDPARSAALNDYMKHNGLLLIDELGAGSELTGTSATQARNALKRATEGLDIPPLMKLGDKHTLSHSFYLLHAYPGRIAGEPVYVARTDDAQDGEENVSPVIIGNGDWARAWAVDESGNTPFAVVPDGENQRALAYRFGVNAVIYALTGNYKNDQKRYPEMLKRLGNADGGADSAADASGNDASGTDAPGAEPPGLDTPNMDEGDGE